jgi:DNA-binding transcriptional MerR regulator
VYTVKQLSDLANVSVRTLHYYDQIGLFEPSRVGENGYRYYDDAAVFRLQQILFFRELGLSLKDIKAVLDRPGFDRLAALRTHRKALQDRVARLNALIQTVDRTILHITDEVVMSKRQLFNGFSKEDEERYAQEAREQYGAEEVDASYARWNSYDEQKKEQIMAEGQAIYTGAVAAMEHGPASPQAQQVMARWHQHMRYFYEPSVERLRGLGQLYVEHPEFAANFRALHPELSEFLREAITHYCDSLES